jgi:hypothetical protein
MKHAYYSGIPDVLIGREALEGIGPWQGCMVWLAGRIGLGMARWRGLPPATDMAKDGRDVICWWRVVARATQVQKAARMRPPSVTSGLQSGRSA